ncbi:MAG: hypothetical protein EXR69_12890 [Myxococcales bacterium]|nr:hypothetical protein [Myxococcales bacterium]
MILLWVGCSGPAVDDSHPGEPPAGHDDTGRPAAHEWASIAGASADGLGNALAIAGDLTGDGLGDLLVAAYLGNRVCVVPAPIPAGPQLLDALPVTCFLGESESDYAGYGMAAVGDTNGDGAGDVLVGSIGNGDGGPNAGRAYLLTGPFAPGTVTLGAAAATWQGETAGDYAGVALAAAGDVTGDGQGDFLVGASGYDDGGTAGGRAYLLPGPLAPGAWALAAATTSFTGLVPDSGAPPPPHGAFGVGDGIGDALLGPGDLNGDGVDDLVLGASGDATLGANTGRVVVFRGPIPPGHRLVSEADLIVTGVSAGSYAGSPSVGPGDLTGDGRADLLIAADGTGPGTVYLIEGSDLEGSVPIDQAAARFEGEADGDLFGFALSAGDVDGDGEIDILVGSPASNRGGDLTGAVWLFIGPFAAGTYRTSTATATYGALGAGSYGSAVSIAPDLDLDGAPDLVAGEYTSDAGGGYSGAVYVFRAP